MRKQRFWSPTCRKFESESDKKWPGNKFKNENKFNAFWTPKTDRNRSRNHSKIDLNPVTGNFLSILLLPWSSRVGPRCQNCIPRCFRATKITTQGAHEVLKRFPKGLLGAKMVPEGAKPSSYWLNSEPLLNTASLHAYTICSYTPHAGLNLTFQTIATYLHEDCKKYPTFYFKTEINGW